MSIKGKKIIVTGGCSGLGEEFTKFLISNGAFVIPTSRNESSIEKFAAGLDENEKKYCNPEVLSFEDETTIDDFVDRIQKKHGEIFGLVNNAVGRYKQKLPEELTIKDFKNEYHVNIFATTYLTIKCVKKIMKSNGAIINISSFYSEVVPDNRVYTEDMQPTSITYASSKAALNYITKYLAVYYSSKNIRVNAILPGGVRNPSRQTEHFVQEYEYRTPMKRMAKKDEFNESLLFLLNENNSYCTGQCISIDGGWSLL